MRVALSLTGLLLATASLSGCLGVDNMAEFKSALGFQPQPLQIHPPVARLHATATRAMVGEPITFNALASSDPQALPLEFRWDFGDGTVATGVQVAHKFLMPGTYNVALRAVNAAGAGGQDGLGITVMANLPPTVSLAILRDGRPVERAQTNQDLAFAATVTDPEGAPLRVTWDFGNGKQGAGTEAHNLYAKGGQYLVTARAEDPAGLAATATRMLAVDQPIAGKGTVQLLQQQASQSFVDVGPAAQGITTVTEFDANLGINNLIVILQDATGAEVQRATANVPLGTQGAIQIPLDVAADSLAKHAPGAWSIVVQRASGVQVAYTVSGLVQY